MPPRRKPTKDTNRADRFTWKPGDIEVKPPTKPPPKPKP